MEKRPGRYGNTGGEEAAIHRANRTPADKDDCEAAIMGAIKLYFKVDVAQ
ncbi:MAG TPA: hypothetical protein PKV09_06075 [Syntrophales bacterium]|nr:hypothetical protein [Syntrophales bacterium]HOX94342.1 hypothetical protein [Syntrophales bacterium]